jgi:hypothetical protein
MPAFPAGFSERVFEFAFNAEYLNAHQAILAAAPDIPTQNAEKWLGYDILVQMHKMGAIHSLALQHKVARYVDTAAPSNSHFWRAVGGKPYFGFRIDVDQYNLIESLSSARLPGIEFYYCAPLFSTRKNMDAHYLGQSVMRASLWIDVAGSGQLLPNESHSIIYADDGSSAYLFSGEGQPLRTLPIRIERPGYQSAINLRETYRVAVDALRDYWPRRTRKREGDAQLPTTLPSRIDPNSSDERAVVEATSELFGRYYGVSWIMEPA